MFKVNAASTLVATAAVLSLVPMGNAHAALVAETSPTCSNSNIFTPGTPPTTLAIDCSGAWNGNDANQQTDVLAQLTSSFGDNTGLGSWTFSGKSDEASNGPFTSNPNSSTGTLTFDSLKTGFFAIALKGSNTFSLYLLDGGTTGIGSFNFDMIGAATNNQGNAQALSHASLYSFTPIPTPALLPGLVGMGIAAWRKRKGEVADSTEA